MERAEELASLPTRKGSTPAVLYIGGTGRSGSTLLEQALSQLPGIVSVGELRALWKAILTDDRRCTCGAVPSDCEFWREVGDRAFGGWRPDHVRSVLKLQQSIDRHRRLVRLLGREANHPGPQTRALAAAWSAVFGAIGQTASARMVVDSSKYPIHAAVLRAGDLDLRIVHLVRDPRGVAFSWAKRGVVKPDSTGDPSFMPVYGYGRTAAEWTVYNLAFDRMRRLGTPTLLLRYESFVGDPAASLDRVLAFADTTGARPDLSFVDGAEIALRGRQHAFGGNPQRREEGSTIHVTLDDAWRRMMPPVRRTQVALVTLPLMVRYGYVGPGTKGRP
jgi:hypothetical protein